MSIGINIKNIREHKGLMQKQIALIAGLHASNHSKAEKGEREPAIDALDKIAKHFVMNVDQIIHYEGNVPQDVAIEDKSVVERRKLTKQLEEEDKQAIFLIIDGMLTKSKFKDFFNKNVAAL